MTASTNAVLAPTSLDLALVRTYVEVLAEQCRDAELGGILRMTSAWVALWATGMPPRAARSAANILGFVLESVERSSGPERPGEEVVDALRKTVAHLRALAVTATSESAQ